MFLGMGRLQYEDNLITVEPVISTINFIKGAVSWKVTVTIVLGNVLMFIPFGFLGWVFPELKNFENLLFTFISTIVIVEALQYFTRMGIFEIDDIILNTFGVCLGFLMKGFIEKRLRSWVV